MLPLLAALHLLLALPELAPAILVQVLPLLPASSAGACTLSISMMQFVSCCTSLTLHITQLADTA